IFCADLELVLDAITGPGIGVFALRAHVFARNDFASVIFNLHFISGYFSAVRCGALPRCLNIRAAAMGVATALTRFDTGAFRSSSRCGTSAVAPVARVGRVVFGTDTHRVLRAIAQTLKSVAGARSI